MYEIKSPPTLFFFTYFCERNRFWDGILMTLTRFMLLGGEYVINQFVCGEPLRQCVEINNVLDHQKCDGVLRAFGIGSPKV